MARTVEIKGEENLKRTMAHAYAEFPKLDGTQQANMVATTARQFAPVRTGQLRRSITGRRRLGGGGIVTVGAPYGFYVENGTRRMTGRKFLARAVSARTPDCVRAYERQVQKELDRVRGA